MKSENCLSCGVRLTTGNLGKIRGRCSECSPFLDLFASALDEPSNGFTSQPSTWVKDAGCPTCGEAIQQRWKVCPFCKTSLARPGTVSTINHPVTETNQTGRKELLWTGVGLLVVGFGSIFWMLYDVTLGGNSGFSEELVGSAIVACMIGGALVGAGSGTKSGLVKGMLGGLLAGVTALLGAALLFAIVVISVILFFVAACLSMLGGG